MVSSANKNHKFILALDDEFDIVTLIKQGLASEVGIPVLLLSRSSIEHIFHSGANDSALSFKTMPQELQTVSLVSTSKMIALPLQLRQSSISLRICDCDSSCFPFSSTFSSTGVSINELIEETRELSPRFFHAIYWILVYNSNMCT